MNPKAASVTTIAIPHGQSVSGETVDAALAEHKPKWAFMAHFETGSGRVNNIASFSEACERHGAMGLVDAVSSLGVGDFRIDDYPGVAAWASCPQKGICSLPLTYAPVSFSDCYIDELKRCGARSLRSWKRVIGASSTAKTWKKALSPDPFSLCGGHLSRSAAPRFERIHPGPRRLVQIPRSGAAGSGRRHGL